MKKLFYLKTLSLNNKKIVIMKMYYSIKEIASILSANENKIRTLIKSHNIPHVRGLAKKRRIQITQEGFNKIRDKYLDKVR